LGAGDAAHPALLGVLTAGNDVLAHLPQPLDNLAIDGVLSNL
jgi:hypothetical protein